MNTTSGQEVSIGKWLWLIYFVSQFNFWTLWISVVLREQQQDDLVELFTQVLNEIESSENIRIRADYVIVDRNGFDGSYVDCKYM